MDEPWQGTIEQIHASGRQFVLAITGGGSGAIGDLLRVPGGSRTLLEAIVPYDRQSLVEFLGSELQHACTPEVAIEMARRARDRAVRLSDSHAGAIGIAATASLVSDRPKQGDHRGHIAAVSETGTIVIFIELAKGLRDRAGEEQLIAYAILHCLAEACGVRPPDIAAHFKEGDRWTQELRPPADEISRLLHGAISRVTVLPDGQVLTAAPVPHGILAGSFHPLHDAHLGLARTAAKLLGAPVSFEISVINADKPPLGLETVRSRIAQFAWRANVELTRAATFCEKSMLFPGATFVVGADTAERIVSPKYYGNSTANLLESLKQIASRGCRFLVAVRATGGQARSLTDVAVPAQFRSLFSEIPESSFRLDISSSAIRVSKGKQTL